jgi:hypothetical protein
MDYRVIAIPSKVADLVRSTHHAPGYGHPAYTEVAAGYGPCRHCLQTFNIGEERRTLFTYDPFYGMEQVPLPGPIFIHAEPCARYAEDAGYPESMREHAAVISAYARGRKLIAEVEATNGGQEAAVRELLARWEVDYLHVRDREAGCFDFRVERVSPPPTHQPSSSGSAV